MEYIAKADTMLSIDTEKVFEVPFTSLETREGDLLVGKFKYAPTVASRTDSTRVADRMHIVLQSDHTIENHETWRTMFDFSLLVMYTYH